MKKLFFVSSIIQLSNLCLGIFGLVNCEMCSFLDDKIVSSLPNLVVSTHKERKTGGDFGYMRGGTLKSTEF